MESVPNRRFRIKRMIKTVVATALLICAFGLPTASGRMALGSSFELRSGFQSSSPQTSKPEYTPKGVTHASPADRKALKYGPGTNTLLLSVPTTAIQYGSPVPIRIKLTNISRHDVEFETGVGSLFEVELLDDKGVLVPITLPSPSGDETDCSGCEDYKLHPGDVWTDDDRLPEWYTKAMKPGTYTMRLGRDNPDGSVDWSNKVTLTIVP